MEGLNKLSNSRVVVTGGAGFIGSHCVELLVERAASVVVLDNFSTGTAENLAPFVDHVEVHNGDVRDLGCCIKALTNADLLLHLAAISSVELSIQNPSATIETNVLGSANIFQAARDLSIARIVYASSASVYGNDCSVPNREGAEGAPTSPYALSKSITEQLADMYAKTYGVELCGLRYFNVYGPRQAPNSAYASVIPKFFSACALGGRPTVYGDGEQTRDFVYVKDIALANFTALTARGAASGVFNVGTGKATSIREVGETVIRLAGGHSSLEYAAGRSGEVLHSQADPSRLETVLGFRPTTSLQTGLAATAPYYLSVAAY